MGEEELRDKKRGRGTDGGDDGTPTMEPGKKRKVRRLKFGTLGEDWGLKDEGEEHHDQPKPVLPPPPVIRRRGAKPSISG